MAEAIASVVLELLISVIQRKIKQEVTLVAGVSKEVERLKENFQVIRAVLIDADQRQVKEAAVSIWLDQLKDISYEMEDVLDEWNTAMLKLQIEGVEDMYARKKKVCFFFPSACFCFKQVGLRRDIALKIKEINVNMNDISEEKNKFDFKKSKSVEKIEPLHKTCQFGASKIYGRDEVRNDLVTRLLCDETALHIISIFGLGGIGKTALAQYAYHDPRVKNNFDKRIWVSVSDSFDEYRIAKTIHEALNCNAPNSPEFIYLMENIHETIQRKKFFLVLDDVWNECYNKWEPFYTCLKKGLPGSKILVTTRKQTVARMMNNNSIDIINIKQLSEDECWLLFTQMAFWGRPQEERKDLEDVGRKIVRKCNGLPLAAKTIGSLLRFKKTRREWERILESEKWEEEQIVKGVLPSLSLSYYDLPSIIRRCFLYCVIFPKDYRMSKDELIRLWMAQGYLGFDESKDMEIRGEEYFGHLVNLSFFQDFNVDDDGHIKSCKMHDIVHEFAQFLNKNESYSVEVSAQSASFPHEKVCHLMLSLKNEVSFPVSIFSIKRLRSLLINCAYGQPLNLDFLLKLFGELTCLRVLRLSGLSSFIHEIPKEIGKLIHLRYLDLNRCGDLEILPESLCELYNLQILDVSYCRRLKELPQGMGKLINLRHLINKDTESLCHMPVGIEKLTGLRTLNKFIVSGGGDDSKIRSLDCLKDFNHLQGELTIRGLGNLKVNETTRIQVLTNKKNLVSLDLRLHLRFARDRERINKDDEILLEAIQPPPDLEKLWIQDHRCIKVFPSWLMSLTKLRLLRLRYFQNCKHLPPLGQLPSLETLIVCCMGSLKKVGEEFCGMENDTTSSSSPSPSSVVLFPKLKKLSFFNLTEWEEWDYGFRVKGEEKITIMPHLASLGIYQCPKLKAVPDHLLQSTKLDKDIRFCPILERRLEKNTVEGGGRRAYISNYHLCADLIF